MSIPRIEALLEAIAKSNEDTGESKKVLKGNDAIQYLMKSK